MLLIDFLDQAIRSCLLKKAKMSRFSVSDAFVVRRRAHLLSQAEQWLAHLNDDSDTTELVQLLNDIDDLTPSCDDEAIKTVLAEMREELGVGNAVHVKQEVTEEPQVKDEVTGEVQEEVNEEMKEEVTEETHQRSYDEEGDNAVHVKEEGGQEVDDHDEQQKLWYANVQEPEVDQHEHASSSSHVMPSLPVQQPQAMSATKKRRLAHKRKEARHVEAGGQQYLSKNKRQRRINTGKL